jgi:hypothetical protein
MVCGVWCMVCGVWCAVCGVWCMVCGVWCMVCGVWCMSNHLPGVWCTVYHILIHCTHTPYAHKPYSHTLYSHTILTHHTHIGGKDIRDMPVLYSHTILTHYTRYTHTPYTHRREGYPRHASTILTHHTHTLYSHTILTYHTHIGGKDIRDMPGPGGYSEVAGPGTGFGLGMSVITDPRRTRQIGSAGSCSWGGVAGTAVISTAVINSSD